MGIPKELNVMQRPVMYRGILNLQGFLKMLKAWLEEHRYEFHENTVKSKLAHDGLRREYRWIAWKNINEYVRYDVTIFMDIRNIERIEVVRAGKKERLTQCRIILEINGKVSMDPEGRFKGNKFLQALQDFMHNYIIKKEILFIWADQLDYRMMKLQRVAKEYLEFEAKSDAFAYKWS